MPFGELLVDNSTVDLDYRFSAKETDRESGLGYFGARYYDNTSAMWLGVDPLWEKYVGMNPYNYCAGNPVMMVDPDGREVKNGYAGDYKNDKKNYEDSKQTMKSTYGDNFAEKGKKDFSSKNEYKEYREAFKEYKIYKKSFEATKRRYDIVNKYIENYKKIDPDGFAKANLLKNEETGDVYDIYLFVDYSYSLADWGGAKTEQRKDSKGVYYSKTTVSMDFNAADDHLAHEFGHSINIAVKPSYWYRNTNSQLNCQEHPNEDQTRTAIEWQTRWNSKYSQYLRR